MPKKIDPAVRERVMRMITEHRSEYATPTALARVLAARERLGVETVRRWDCAGRGRRRHPPGCVQLRACGDQGVESPGPSA